VSSGSGLAAGARNRLVLRAVNDRIAELAGDWNEIGVGLFVCECSDLGWGASGNQHLCMEA
jgi:hypothetical protein